MKEFIEKLIGRLEELKSLVPVNRVLDNIIESKPKELGQLIAYEKSIKAVNELAEEFGKDTNVTTKDGWIPCSERLPEEDGNYLVQQEDGRINILHYCKGWNCTYMDVDKTRWSNACERKDIIAWQPLPAPFKKGE